MLRQCITSGMAVRLSAARVSQPRCRFQIAPRHNLDAIVESCAGNTARQQMLQLQPMPGLREDALRVLGLVHVGSSTGAPLSEDETHALVWSPDDGK